MCHHMIHHMIHHMSRPCLAIYLIVFLEALVVDTVGSWVAIEVGRRVPSKNDGGGVCKSVTKISRHCWSCEGVRVKGEGRGGRGVGGERMKKEREKGRKWEKMG